MRAVARAALKNVLRTARSRWLREPACGCSAKASDENRLARSRTYIRAMRESCRRPWTSAVSEACQECSSASEAAFTITALPGPAMTSESPFMPTESW